jgi:hypothetical protein
MGVYLTRPPLCLDTQRGYTGLHWKDIRWKGVRKLGLELRNGIEPIHSCFSQSEPPVHVATLIDSQENCNTQIGAYRSSSHKR